MPLYGKVACAPGLDCAHSFYCPAYTEACPEGSLCNSYEGLVNIDSTLLENADESYVKYKWQGVFGGLEDEDKYEGYIEKGRYVQSLCIRGFYCPNNRSIIKCPAGSWCPEGVREPIICDVMSLCPSGSYYQVNFVNFLIACLLSVVIFTLAFIQRSEQRAREKLSRGDNASDVGSSKVLPRQLNGVQGTIELRDVSSHQESYARSGITFKFGDITATCRDLNYSDNDKVILNDISGELIAGEISGILGPSGCGKSTLISVLRDPTTVCKGSIEILVAPDLRKLSPSELPKRIGYVPQEDIVDRQCTVRELLEFNCLARVSGISKEIVEERVESVLKDLQIIQIADTVIGGSENSNANISGGQMKRVSIACELVALSRPAALLCDEPTAGLDSSVAEDIVRNLGELCKRGITVGLILQQPRPEIFASLDKVFLMEGNGSLVYAGAPHGAAASLQSRGYSQPEDCSDADFCIDVLNDIIPPAGDKIASDIKRIQGISIERKFNANFDESSIEKVEDRECDKENLGGIFTMLESYQHLIILQMRRAWTIRMRNITSLVIYAFISILMSSALSVGFSIFIQGSYFSTLTPPVHDALKKYFPSVISKDTQDHNIADLGFQQLLFFMSSALGCAASLAAVPLFSTPWSIVEREHNVGIHVVTYGIGRIIADTVNVVWMAFMFLGVWLLFGHAGSWYNWIAVIVSTSYAASGVGYACTVLSRPGYASTTSILVTFMCCVFSGVTPTLKQVENLHVVNLLWYLSYGTWAAESTYKTWTSYLPDHKNVAKAADTYGYDTSYMDRSVAILISLGFLWRIFTVWLLYIKMKNGGNLFRMKATSNFCGTLRRLIRC